MNIVKFESKYRMKYDSIDTTNFSQHILRTTPLYSALNFTDVRFQLLIFIKIYIVTKDASDYYKRTGSFVFAMFSKILCSFTNLISVSKVYLIRIEK